MKFNIGSAEDLVFGEGPLVRMGTIRNPMEENMVDVWLRLRQYITGNRSRQILLSVARIESVEETDMPDRLRILTATETYEVRGTLEQFANELRNAGVTVRPENAP